MADAQFPDVARFDEGANYGWLDPKKGNDHAEGIEIRTPRPNQRRIDGEQIAGSFIPFRTAEKGWTAHVLVPKANTTVVDGTEPTRANPGDNWIEKRDITNNYYETHIHNYTTTYVEIIDFGYSRDPATNYKRFPACSLFGAHGASDEPTATVDVIAPNSGSGGGNAIKKKSSGATDIVTELFERNGVETASIGHPGTGTEFKIEGKGGTSEVVIGNGTTDILRTDMTNESVGINTAPGASHDLRVNGDVYYGGGFEVIGTSTLNDTDVTGTLSQNGTGVSLIGHVHAASDVSSGTFANARIAASNVTQHEGSIDHDSLDNYQLDQHRTLNDSGTGTTDLWSASKIQSELDQVVSGFEFRASVETVADSNVTLSGEQTINGVTTSASRVGVIGQTDASENGIYTTASGAWSRTADADVSAEVNSGMTFFAYDGTKKGFQYILVTDDPITLDTTDLEFTEVPKLELGTTAGTAAEGNDARIPTQDENDALAGTGTPSSSNKYVTNDDARLGYWTESSGNIYRTTGSFGIGIAPNSATRAHFLGDATHETLRLQQANAVNNEFVSFHYGSGSYGGFEIQSSTLVLRGGDTHKIHLSPYFTIYDANTGLTVNTNGEVDLWDDVRAGSDLDVGGDITVSGTVDGRDVAADGAVIDSIDSLATAPATLTGVGTGEVLQYVGSEWINRTFTEADIATKTDFDTHEASTAEHGLNISGPAIGEVLQYTGSAFVNRTLAAADIAQKADFDSHEASTAEHGATGAVVGTTNTQTLSDKTLTAPILTTPQIDDASGTHQYIFASAELAADRQVSLPLLTTNDTFVFEAFPQTLTNKTLTSAANDLTIDPADVTGLGDLATAPATLTSVGAGEVLQYIGAEWINRTFAEADIATDSDLTTHTGESAIHIDWTGISAGTIHATNLPGTYLEDGDHWTLASGRLSFTAGASPADTGAVDILAPHSQLKLTDTDDSSFAHLSVSGSKMAIRIDDTTSAPPLFVDGTTNRVGILDLTPSYTLDVAGDVNSQGTLRQGGTAVSLVGHEHNAADDITSGILPTARGGTGIDDLSTYMQTLLDDADAGVARTTLGITDNGIIDWTGISAGTIHATNLPGTYLEDGDHWTLASGRLSFTAGASPADTGAVDILAPHSQLKLTDTDDSSFAHFSVSGSKMAIRIDDTTSAPPLFVDGTTNRVGILDLTPSYTLDVAGDINSQGTLRQGGTAVSLVGHDHALDDLTTVSVGAPAPGEYLRFAGAEWVASSILDSDLPAIALDDLSDVTTTAPPAEDAFLKYQGGLWGDGSIVEGDLPDLSSTYQPADPELDTWATKTAPAGDVVGTTDSQTISGKILNTTTINTPILTLPDTAVNPTVSGLINWDSTEKAVQVGDGAAGTVHLRDWSDDQSAFETIHASNLPDLSGTYSAASHEHNLDELTDVTIGAPVTGNYVRYVTGVGWGESTIPLGDLPAVALDDLSDVTTTAPPAEDAFLKYQGGLWGDGSIVEGDLPDLSSTYQPADPELDTWATKTAPAGDVVGTTDSQTISGKILNTTTINTPILTLTDTAVNPTVSGLINWDSTEMAVQVGDGAAGTVHLRDWSDDQSAFETIHASNLPDLSGTYAAASHEHNAEDDITSGILPTARGGTGINDLSTFSQGLLDETSDITWRLGLGLGTMSVQDAGTVAIVGGTISGTTITLNTGSPPTTEGRMLWDAGNNCIMIGSGAGTKYFHDWSVNQITADIDIENIPVGSIDHDSLSGYVANEHLDWTQDQGATVIHAGNVNANHVTQHEGSIDHDSLSGYVAAEHYDWTQDQGAFDIDPANIPVTAVTQHQGSIDHDSLSGVEILTPGSGDYLRYDGANWAESPILEQDLPAWPDSYVTSSDNFDALNETSFTTSTTATETVITQGLTVPGYHVKSTLTNAHYVPGMVWSTTDDNPTKPKAAIWAKEFTANMEMYLGVAGTFATGIENHVMITSSGGLQADGLLYAGTTVEAEDDITTNSGNFYAGTDRLNPDFFDSTKTASFNVDAWSSSVLDRRCRYRLTTSSSFTISGPTGSIPDFAVLRILLEDGDAASPTISWGSGMIGFPTTWTSGTIAVTAMFYSGTWYAT